LCGQREALCGNTTALPKFRKSFSARGNKIEIFLARAGIFGVPMDEQAAKNLL
jgi:hypothetical protein